MRWRKEGDRKRDGQTRDESPQRADHSTLRLAAHNHQQREKHTLVPLNSLHSMEPKLRHPVKAKQNNLDPIPTTTATFDHHLPHPPGPFPLCLIPPAALCTLEEKDGPTNVLGVSTPMTPKSGQFRSDHQPAVRRSQRESAIDSLE